MNYNEYLLEIEEADRSWNLNDIIKTIESDISLSINEKKTLIKIGKRKLKTFY